MVRPSWPDHWKIFNPSTFASFNSQSRPPIRNERHSSTHRMVCHRLCTVRRTQKKVVSEYADNLIYTRRCSIRLERQTTVSTMRDSEIYTTVGKMNFFKWFIESKLWDKISTEGNDLSQLMALHPEHKYKKQLQRNSSRHKSPLLNFWESHISERISIRLSFFAIVGIRSPLCNGTLRNHKPESQQKYCFPYTHAYSK
jgi:hypothetical protein